MVRGCEAVEGVIEQVDHSRVVMISAYRVEYYLRLILQVMCAAGANLLGELHVWRQVSQ